MNKWIYKQFNTRDAMNKWLESRKGKIQYNEIFVNNAYAIEYRKLRRIY